MVKKELDVIVFGTLNVDLISEVERFPVVGETYASKSFAQTLGGKAANQAIAAQRLGKKTAVVGKTGYDIFNSDIQRVLKDEGVNTANISMDDKQPSGNSFVVVDAKGSNIIITNLGANQSLTIEDVNRALPMVKKAKVALLQLEMPFNVREYLIRKLHEQDVTTILNLAPVVKMPADTLKLVDVLIVNEVEAEQLTGIPIKTVEDAKKAIRILTEQESQRKIITLGANGAVIYENNETYHIKPPKVKSIDTTGAGDCFCGSIAAFFKEDNFRSTVNKSILSSTFSVTKKGGAIHSFPYLQEVENLFNK